ncbi:hypothetical protein [Blastococcus sp. Marseille-P5729]|uniref:hypothetical protein n=1 Tax=Blastococcus sp. Marseille-P5729 TaxID=2086582 RepID=UPI000D0FB219|nr:hypothetical protein [Blastococcus sp. Marseille-P5729]
MTESQSSVLQDLPAQPNPYTDERPLVVRDHPMRENSATVATGAVVLAAPLIWVLVRLLTDQRPVLTSQLILALVLAVPLGVLMVCFPLVISSGTWVTVGSTRLTRGVKRSRGATKTVALTDIRGGVYASRVRYRRGTGAELVLFLPENEVVWIADGIAPGDVARIARASSTYGIKEYADPITNDQLQALIRKARRAS